MKTPTNIFDTPLWAATTLAPVAPPKVKAKQQSYPSYVRSTAPT
jgi:hypothetical protein